MHKRFLAQSIRCWVGVCAYYSAWANCVGVRRQELVLKSQVNGILYFAVVSCVFERLIRHHWSFFAHNNFGLLRLPYFFITYPYGLFGRTMLFRSFVWLYSFNAGFKICLFIDWSSRNIVQKVFFASDAWFEINYFLFLSIKVFVSLVWTEILVELSCNFFLFVRHHHRSLRVHNLGDTWVTYWIFGFALLLRTNWVLFHNYVPPCFHKFIWHFQVGWLSKILVVVCKLLGNLRYFETLVPLFYLFSFFRSQRWLTWFNSIFFPERQIHLFFIVFVQQHLFVRAKRLDKLTASSRLVH